MASDAQRAADAANKIEQQKQHYLAATQAFCACFERGESVNAQIQCVRRLHEQATAFFNCVDGCISESELLGAHRSEHWARDLANTAFNALDNIPQLYDRIWKECDRLGIQRPAPSPNAFYAMQSSVTVYNADQCAKLRERFEVRELPIRGFTHPARMNTRYANWEKIFMGATGVVFVLILLAIGIWVKDLNNFNIFVFRSVLALVGGAFAAIFIPGLLQIKTAVVRATGAVAVFAVIFFFNPPALVQNVVNSDAQQRTTPSATPTATVP